MAKNAARKLDSSNVAGDKVVVKKVPAFPINAQIKIGAMVANVQILRLNTLGLMAQVSIGNLKMGDKCEITFELPVLHHSISEQMVVIKQYNHWQGGQGTAAQTPSKNDHKADNKSGDKPADLSVGHLVELHFAALSPSAQAQIVHFLNAAHIVD